MRNRRSSALDDTQVRSFPLFAIAYRRRVRAARTAGDRTRAWMWGGERFCELAKPFLKSSPATIFAFTSAARELFSAGRDRGMTLVLDHATAPRRHEMRLVAEEMQRFPGWARFAGKDDAIDDYHERQMAETRLAHRVICSSAFARDALIEQGVATEKIRRVPLGLDGGFPAAMPPKQPSGPLRVLFVGGDGLRKGIGYLHEAMRLLRAPSIQVKVAGDLELSEAGSTALSRHLELLGPVARAQVIELYAWADVLVLPSISDTFGLVVLEAMACGVPVIASRNTCGPDVIRGGEDGFVVPIRDAAAIASCLDRLAGDRGLLLAMAESARQRAGEFTSAQYCARLLAAIA